MIRSPVGRDDLPRGGTASHPTRLGGTHWRCFDTDFSNTNAANLPSSGTRIDLPSNVPARTGWPKKSRGFIKRYCLTGGEKRRRIEFDGGLPGKVEDRHVGPLGIVTVRTQHDARRLARRGRIVLAEDHVSLVDRAAELVDLQSAADDQVVADLAILVLGRRVADLHVDAVEIVLQHADVAAGPAAADQEGPRVVAMLPSIR